MFFPVFLYLNIPKKIEIMKTSRRLDLAIQKLYNAFHNKELHPECCQLCAVGTILDGTDYWKQLSDHHGSLQLNYIGQVNEAFGKRFNGYKPSELLLIEQTFLKACGFVVPLHHNNPKPANPTTDEDLMFNALYEVVKLLCKLDHVPNMMDHYIQLGQSMNPIQKDIIALQNSFLE